MKMIQWIRRHWIVTALTFVLVFVIGIPLLINFSYSVDPILITKWNAADVLGYYGDVLGSVVAVAIMAGTIYATRQDAISEVQFQQKKESWKKVEEKVDLALEAINPTQLNALVSDTLLQLHESDIGAVLELYSKLEHCQYSVNNCMRCLMADVNNVEYSAYSFLVKEIEEVASQLIEIKREYSAYITQFAVQQYAIATAQKSSKKDDTPSKVQVISSADFIKKTEDVLNRTQALFKREYTELLIKKSKVFDSIYSRLS